MTRRTILTSAVVLMLLAPVAAQEPAWRVEPPARNTAATILRVFDDRTFYGFTCHRRRWSFFLNHVPPEGGACEDHHACEVVIGRVTNHVKIGSAPEREAVFDLFENTYYKAGEVTREEMAALIAAPAVSVRFDPRLAAVWGLTAMTLPMDGLGAALDGAARRFDCPR